MAEFYDWSKTLSYDADVTMVIGARGIGKTFGLRRQCIRDWIRHKSRFVEVTRYNNELSGVSDGFFNRLSALDEFQDYTFKTDARYAYIAAKPESDSEKPHWDLIAYFASLSSAQRMKKRTFDNVKRIVFDETILERADRYHRYLPNEFGILANLVDTVSRERADTDSIRPRVYLLGNACDLANPYFAAYGVGTDITFGYRWYANKTFLLHYVDPGEYSIEKAHRTVAGRMIANTEAGNVAIQNQFVHASSEFILKKPGNAVFSFGIVCNGRLYGIWLDERNGYYHVTRKVPNNTGKPIFSLTRQDASINYVAASNLSVTMRYVADMYYHGLLRYDDESLEMEFSEVLAMFGVR